MKHNGPQALIDLEVQIHHETDKAILVSDDGDREKAVWLPLSQIEIERRSQAKHSEGQFATIVVPEWLALKEGLI